MAIVPKLDQVVMRREIRITIEVHDDVDIDHEVPPERWRLMRRTPPARVGVMHYLVDDRAQATWSFDQRDTGRIDVNLDLTNVKPIPEEDDQ